jgi:hypothetical protein
MSDFNKILERIIDEQDLQKKGCLIDDALMEVVGDFPATESLLLDKLKEASGVPKKNLNEQLIMLKKLRDKKGAKKVAEPESYEPRTLSEAKATIKKWLVINDDEIIDVIFAAAIAEKLPGDPFWLFVIAPPGGGKTELLRALGGKDFYHLSDLTSKTFISGLMLGEGEARKKIDDLLPQLNRKVLVFKDFTTILEKNKDERREILSQFREIYDGSFAKKFGTIDEKVEYRARFGFIAGVTPILDKHYKVMQQLGERFLKYRMEDDEQELTTRAEQNEGSEEVMREEIGNAVMGFLSHLLVRDDVTLSPEQSKQIIEAARFLAVCRTPVVIQSSKSDFYHDYIPTPELPTRLVKQLKKGCKALAIVRGRGTVSSEDVATVVKLTLHTCPPDRLHVLKAVQELYNGMGDGVTVSEIKKKVSLPVSSLRRVCEQLVLLNLLEETSISRERGGYREDFTVYRQGSALPPLIRPDASGRSEGERAHSSLFRKLIPNRDEKLVRGVAELLKRRGGLTTDEILAWNSRLSEEHLRQAAEQGLIYEPRAGYWEVLE